MEKTTLTRLKLELESFKILVTSNMIGAALTLAFSMAFGITKVIPFITGGPLEPDQLPYLMIIISGFATAISWITRSAELMGEHDEIIKDLDVIINEYVESESDTPEIGSEQDEQLIGIIIRFLAFYRENAVKINQLKWGGRLTGTFLLITGIPQLVSFLTGSYQVEGWAILAQVFAVVSSLAISLAAWYVPVIIKRFTETWDARLNMADDANEKLKSILEGEA